MISNEARANQVASFNGSRVILKEMCSGMIRKDFEIMRVQNMFSNIFSDIDIYSQYDDEFSSIEMIILIAFNHHSKDLKDDPYDYIVDCGLKLAFSYFDCKGSVLSRIKNDSESFVHLVFEAAGESGPLEAKIKFLRKFMKRYPYLNLEDSNTQLIEAIKEREFENEQYC